MIAVTDMQASIFSSFSLFVSLLTSVMGCSRDSLASYRVTFHAEWSEDQFPKQYPKWRPPAQWSVVIGRTHNSSYKLWHLGNVSSEAVKLFMQQGKMDGLMNSEAQGGDKGVLDEFYMPSLRNGVGTTESQFLVASNYSQLSLMAKLIPSPDWFVGIDSLNLCNAGNWLDEISVDVSPLDAGVENGFAFTSPKWETEIAAPITRITAHFPNHRANSFYYPQMKKLPRIGYFHISRIREYSLKTAATRYKQKENINRAANVNFATLEARYPADKEINAEPLKDIDGMLKQLNEQVPSMKHRPALSPQRVRNQYKFRSSVGEQARFVKKSRRKEIHMNYPAQQEPVTSVPVLQRDATSNALSDIPRNELKKAKNSEKEVIKKSMKTRNPPRHCLVSEWSDWSPCSSTCGSGENTRHRRVVQPSRRRGRPCPALQESRWCGSRLNCHQPTAALSNTYFRW